MVGDIGEKIKELGLLLEKDIFDSVLNFPDSASATTFLESVERASNQRIITKALLEKERAVVQRFVKTLSQEKQNIVEKVFVKLGIQLEVIREQSVETPKSGEVSEGKDGKSSYQIFYAPTGTEKKLTVSDFVGNFRARYQQLQRLLMARPELQANLVSIGKISADRQNLSIIGLLGEKRVTKNKNLILKFEDLTGSISVLVKHDDEELFEKASELQLDDVVGIKCSGSREFLFAREIIFPDSFNLSPGRFDEDVHIAILSDTHCGGKLHFGEELGKFFDWLNSEDPIAKKIEFLFFVGDNVDGVGIFPSQEDTLKLKTMKEQYELLASYLRRVPERITMFLCPGQHDAVRVAEPQPPVGKYYAAPLHEIPNLVLVTNPTLVKLTRGDKVFKVLMYHGASIHTFINEVKELRELKAHTCPAKAVKHMLKRRHLAPTHSSVVYIPNVEADPLVISEVPDVLCTGEVHRLDIDNYHGTIIITGSCWQAQTKFEESIGNIPIPCKVPIINLKTREVSVLDFEKKAEEVPEGIVKTSEVKNEA